MNESLDLSMFEELDEKEMEDIQGGIGKVRCAYLWTMCLAYPGGCTSPCTLWRDLCSN